MNVAPSCKEQVWVFVVAFVDYKPSHKYLRVPVSLSPKFGG